MWDDTLEFLKFMTVVIAFVVVVVFPIVYQSCTVTAQVVNEEFGTSYVWSDILWAGDAIENVVLGRKARIDLNDARN